jgi:hypothetical protein
MGREHARPQPPAAGTEEGQRSQPRCRSGSLATEPSGPGAKLDPPDHTHPSPAPPWTQGVPGLVRLWKWACEGSLCRSGYTQCQQQGAAPLPNPALGAAATAYEPRTRAASAPGRQPPAAGAPEEGLRSQPRCRSGPAASRSALHAPPQSQHQTPNQNPAKNPGPYPYPYPYLPLHLRSPSLVSPCLSHDLGHPSQRAKGAKSKSQEAGGGITWPLAGCGLWRPASSTY